MPINNKYHYNKNTVNKKKNNNINNNSNFSNISDVNRKDNSDSKQKSEMIGVTVSGKPVQQYRSYTSEAGCMFYKINPLMLEVLCFILKQRKCWIQEQIEPNRSVIYSCTILQYQQHKKHYQVPECNIMLKYNAKLTSEVKLGRGLSVVSV